jgi:hypothetical protein
VTLAALRVARVLGIAAAYWLIFTASQTATAARNAGETLPGITATIGVLTVLFTIGAFVTERTQGPDQAVRKDLLWGLSLGGVAILLHRLAA